MRKLIAQLVILGSLMGGLAYYVYASQYNICNRPLSYAIGGFDTRFGILESDFLKSVQDAEAVWEAASGRQFFNYDANAKFKINLIFDNRQAETIVERQERERIEAQQKNYKGKVDSYNVLLAEQTDVQAQYESDTKTYNDRLVEYNKQVSYWNSQGGAPSPEYKKLQQEKFALQTLAKQVDSERLALQSKTTQLNTLAASINASAKDLNLDVDIYNGQFGLAKEFDQGVYTGKEINIFQFGDKNDLKLVIAHELGHALGVQHLDDPKAIMYYLMEQQNVAKLSLTASDLAALKAQCKI